MKVFTWRSVAVGIAAGALVAGVLALLLGVVWGLAALNGLAAAAIALALSVIVRDGRFDMLDMRRRRGVWALACAVMLGPMLFADIAVDIEFQTGNRPTWLALKTLFGLTAFAAYCLGGIGATLNRLDDESRPPPDRPERLVTPDE